MAQSNRIVVNTGPLIALSAIEHLDLLNALLNGYRIHDTIIQAALREAGEN